MTDSFDGGSTAAPDRAETGSSVHQSGSRTGDSQQHIVLRNGRKSLLLMGYHRAWLRGDKRGG